MANAPSPHGLDSTHHEGTLTDAQAPQFLKTDGSRALTGNLAVSSGVTVDGVDISVFYNNYQTHLGDALSHNYIRNLLDDSGVAAPKGVTTNDVKLYGGTGITVTKTTEGLQIAATGGGGGGGSSFSGIKDPASTGVAPDGLGWILTTDDNVVNVAASGANTLAFTVNQGNISHGNLGGVTANQHHNQQHVLATNSGLGGDHTISGATAGYVLRASSATAAAFARLAHSDLSSAGTNSHAQIDSHIAATGTAVHGLGTMSTQAAANVAITGGSITGITDLAIADGGTGASTAAAAATNLGLGTGNSPQFTAVNVGHATDTTIARVSAGLISVEGDTVALLTATQTLTNKTLTTPTISGTGFTNAQHAHAGASSGGTIAHSSTTGRTANDHHNQSHVLATNTALGPDHTISGATAGHVLRASSATAAAFAAIQDADLPSTIVRTSRTLTAGAGLTGGGDLSADRTFNVGAGTLITVAADTVGLSVGSAQYQMITTGASPFTPAYTAMSTLAGAGLSFSAGVLAVGAGAGITVNADDVALTTPGTLTASTSNSSTGNHTHTVTTGAATTLSVSTANGAGSSASLARADHLHTITSSSNPGAAASLLATDSVGKLNLAVLGVGGLPAGSDKFNVVGHATLDSADFSGATTFADDLSVVYAGYYPLYVNVNTVTPSASNVGIMTNTPDPQFALDVAGPARAEMFVGPHALQLADAEMIVHFDGPRPYATDYSGFSTGHMGQAGTESGGVIYRPGKFGKAVQIAEATTNLISNPSFENDVTTGWSFDGKTGGTRTQSSDAYYGSYSCKITSHTGPAGSYLAMWPSVSLVAYTTYVFSLWCKNVNLSLSPFFSIIDVGGGSVTLASGSFSPTNEWSRVQIQFTTGASVSDVRCYIRIGVNGGSFLIDGVQLEAKAYVTPYCDGSLGTGHSWSGTAHASTSSRTDASLSYSTPTNIQPAGTMATWIKVASSSGGNQVICDFRDATHTTAAVLYFASLVPTWFFDHGDRIVASSGAISANTWVHIAVTYDLAVNSHSLYVNGVSVGTSSFADSGWSIGSSLWFGRRYTAAQWVNGYIDDVLILSRAATADEIRAIYESNAPVFAESSVFSFRAPTRSPVWVDEEGLWMRSYSGNATLGIYAGEATKSWGGLTLYDSDLAIGNSTAGYVHWHAGVDADDTTYYGSPSLQIAGRMHVKNNSTFDGTISIGSSGGIYQGTGTFASPTTGLKIWNDSGVGRIGGYNSGTAQWYASTDGKLYAGAGSVTLDANGIVISANDAGLMVWKNAGNSIGQFVSGRSSTINSLHLNAVNTTSLGSVRIAAHAKDNGDSWISLVEDAVSNNFKGVFIGKVGGEPTAMLDVYGDGKFSDTLTLPNTGLHLLDTDASHDLIIAPGSNLTADRTLTVTTGDANRTLTLTGNLTIGATTSITGGGTLALAGYTLTVPKTGTVPVGTGTAGRVAEWVTDANTLQASTLAKTGAGVLTLSAASAYTLTVSGTSAINQDVSTAGSPTFASVTASNGHVTASGASGGRLRSLNPNNQTAEVWLGWINDVASIRYGGSGAGATNGLEVTGSGNSVKLKVLDNGGVLVGTTTDSGYKLDISGTLRATGAAYLTDIRPVSDSTTALQLKRSGGTAVVTVDTTNSRVGINTSSPGVALHVIGAATVTADMVVGNNVIYADTAFNRLGINTSSPGYPLQVEGQSRFNGNVGINDAPDGSYSLKVNGDAYMNRVGLGTAPNASYRIDAAGNVKIGGDIWATGDLEVDGNVDLAGWISRYRVLNQSISASGAFSTGVTVGVGEAYWVSIIVMTTSGGSIRETSIQMVTRSTITNYTELIGGTTYDHYADMNGSNQIQVHNTYSSTLYFSISILRVL